MDTVVGDVRKLAQAQRDISKPEISLLLQEFTGQPDELEGFVSSEQVIYEMKNDDQAEIHYPVLGAALREFGRSLLASRRTKKRRRYDAIRWETLIRRLVSMGFDLHASLESLVEKGGMVDMTANDLFLTTLARLWTSVLHLHGTRLIQWK